MADMDEGDAQELSSPNPILHVLVVGFHHKKGCQVEYSFPPLVPGSKDETECPPGWKYLPTLALPDGSHNYDDDTVYFHLPSLTHPRKTVYGISCFRQIPVEKLKHRTPDMTRGTVQKSVCVLSDVPLFGHIQVKMELITHAYFDEGDFSKVSLLQDTYHHLNSCLSQIDNLQSAPQLFVGLSTRDLILQFRHKALILFKLLLLERKVVFYRSPVQPLCSTILSLLSLHPGMIERGLTESACVRPSRPLSPIPHFADSPDKEHIDKSNTNLDAVPERVAISQDVSSTDSGVGSITTENSELTNAEESQAECISSPGALNGSKWLDISTKDEMDGGVCPSGSAMSASQNTSPSGVGPVGMEPLPRDCSSNDLACWQQNNLAAIAQINPDECGAPLQIFTKGYLCLPYLSLPYMDLLFDVNVRGYLVGATNVLFKQKRQLMDVLVEVENATLETQDPILRRQLHLTTEDLRFADFLVRHVAEERHDVFLDGVGWEGGDEWIRAQFRVYLLCLLRTSILQDHSREIDQFNGAFINAWKNTSNYQAWLASEHDGILELNPGHPFAGQLSVADMKLRLSHTMQNTEGGRKVTQAVVSTGKAVGGALNQAKGALSNWWSNLTANQVTGTVVDDAELAAAEADTLESHVTGDPIQSSHQNSME
ncbi:Late secretory pathway protein AVL9-like protein [Frankliniella fusca]|uniref:Late secretory pathway protein AVL9-like protein n=1 Tax=Frankliniella fusca TaxID=407009 RepID=A0AAE1H6Q9_9NEOP|nr:Late secretory pathway protein AVL9-like protein [Frankliniella fusca]